jgi:hypothetical protein
MEKIETLQSAQGVSPSRPGERPGWGRPGVYYLRFYTAGAAHLWLCSRLKINAKWQMPAPICLEDRVDHFFLSGLNLWNTIGFCYVVGPTTRAVTETRTCLCVRNRLARPRGGDGMFGGEEGRACH